MAVETDADRSNYLDPDLFGVEARYEAVGSNVAPKSISGIFDDEHRDYNPSRWPGSEYQMQSGAHFNSTHPTLVCKTADLPRGGRQGDKVTVPAEGGVRYRVHDVRPDGTGITVLVLMIDD